MITTLSRASKDITKNKHKNTSEIAEIAVAVVVGVDDDLFYDNLGVDHDELQLVLAGRRIGEFYLQPADVVKDLVAAKHLSTVPPTAEQQVVVGWKRLQYLRLRKVLLSIFAELIV